MYRKQDWKLFISLTEILKESIDKHDEFYLLLVPKSIQKYS